MKRIKNIAHDIHKTSEVILMMARSGGVDPQRGGIGVDDMRNRIRIMDVIEADKNADEWTMEDSDFANLTRIIKAGMWFQADRNLLKVVDAILDSESVKSKPKLVDGAEAG